MKSSFPFFESLNKREWNNYEITLIPLYSLKILIFILLKFKENEIRFNKFFTKSPNIALYIQPFYFKIWV